MEISDFVSGYAATNVYEDFAETALFYMLHNDDFVLKSYESEILEQKYNFFRDEVFINQEFQNTDFSTWELEDYYRDITKIDFSLENFLDYLRKAV